ncbi:MAG TPA: GAF domain-containing protein, partial [Magnetococcales bacterium]|nr:GAF domain-containing protein [Magnetococcales bacterium]
TKQDGSHYPHQECSICLTSKDGKLRTEKNELFWRRDGSSFPVEYTATPILENNELKGAVVVFRDISDRLKAETLNQQLLLLQRVVNYIHKISYESIPLGKQLEKALVEILTIPWFFNQSKGALFLANEDEKRLEMVAQVGLDEMLLTACAKVPYGHCLCGRTAQTNTFLHVAAIGDQHDIRFDGMKPHGHYIVPLVSGQRTIGVLNLYLEHGHVRDAHEEEALNAIAHSLARLIERRQAEENLLIRNADLEEKVRERTAKLEDYVESLQKYQHQLIRSERMAALGSMVAGVAHEINTPIGIAFTSATFLKSKTKKFSDLAQSGQLTYEPLHDYLNVALESSNLIETNLKRAAELVKSFKMVAVDQSSQELRKINLRSYLNEIILSMRPKLKNTKYSTSITCAEDFNLETFPGAISQILTNLVMNSLLHGFDELDRGEIKIDAFLHDSECVLIYQDNGKGINPDGIKRLFEPFYTTRRSQGGSGLGMYVVYNQVTQKLKGTISCHSAIGEGVLFVIKFPWTLQEDRSLALQETNGLHLDS